MARLRKQPINAPASPFFPPPTSATRSSPRKTTQESPSKRELRYTSLDSDDSFLVPKTKAGGDAEISPVRKQRVLRPVESNSRLLRKLSDDSLAATPDRRERRQRESGLGRDSGNLSYSRMLAKSLAKKQQGRRLDAGLSFEASIMSSQIFEQQTVVDEDEVEKSILCEEEDTSEGNKENVDIHVDDEAEEEEEEAEEDEDDDESVVNVMRRRQQPQSRRIVIDSDEESEHEVKSSRSKSQKAPSREVSHEVEIEMPPPLTSTRPPFRKGRSHISNWAQEVIDLTGSPEPPASFAMPPPVRMRSASMAASTHTATSESNDVDAILHL